MDKRFTNAYIIIYYKQGCMISPILFNFYLSSLPDRLNKLNTGDVELNNKPLSCILYADDFSIIFPNQQTDYKITTNKLWVARPLPLLRRPGNQSETKIIGVGSCMTVVESV